MDAELKRKMQEIAKSLNSNIGNDFPFMLYVFPFKDANLSLRYNNDIDINEIDFMIQHLTHIRTTMVKTHKNFGDISPN